MFTLNESFHFSGVPAITLPVAVSGSGLPIGFQLIGKHLQEQQLLSVAKWIEREVCFPHLNLDHLDNEDDQDQRVQRLLDS